MFASLQLNRGNLTRLMTAIGSVFTWSGGSTGLTPATPTSGNVVLAGTLNAAHGGTGLTSLGTGVATALGVNVGTAGAPVVNGGVLGTPSSGTLSSCTGLPGTGVAATSTAWTPIDASGAGLTFSSVSAAYQQIGSLIFASFRVTYPVTVDGTQATIGGLPVTSVNTVLAAGPSLLGIVGGAGAAARVVQNTTTFIAVNAAGVGLTNANLSTLTVFGQIIYRTV